MADHFLAALGCARRALARPADPAADAHLLDRFVRDRDERAFAELVARHGPVVWAACRRRAATAADAEDAFQATFLVLARRAARVRRQAAVSGWLFRVAVRLAARTRARAALPAGPARPAADPAPSPADRAAWQDLVSVLDAELAALPDAVRAALVCCYYEGLTQDEAARQLGWKVRTVRARVGRGRAILRTRLARRGVDLGAALAAAAVGLDAPAVVPQMSLTPAAAGVASPAVADLVGHGLALTSGAVSLRLAVAAVVVVAAGLGYALIAGPSWAPAGSSSGPPRDFALPSRVAEPPADPIGAVDPVAIYNRAVDGCVYIVRETNGGTVEGTGALIDKERRLVLTTCRVVGDSDVLSVQFPYHNADGTLETDRKEYARSAAAKLTPMGRVVHRDQARDLALVQLDRLGRHARPLELAEAGIRGTVLHIGSGTGPLFPMTVRKVLAVDTPAVTGAAEPVQAPRIALSGATDDSGGLLVDREGKLVGVVAGPADRNVTLAIDMAEVRAFLAEKDKEIPTPPAPPESRDSDPPVDRTARDFGPPIDPKDFDAATKDLYEKCVKSTVFIVTPVKGGYGMGSGSLIDAEKKLVLTSFRVVDEEPTVFVQFPVYLKDGGIMTDKKEYLRNIPIGKAIKGTVLYRDKNRDLAVVQLARLPPDAKAIPLAKRSVGVGARVINIGTPGRFNTTFTSAQGAVRAVGVERFLLTGSNPDSVFEIRTKMLTTTNPILPGDSGGPVIDRRGYQVAVTESVKSADNVSRCIDVTEVWAFLNEKKVVIKDLTDGKDEPKRDPNTDEIPPANGKGTEGSPKSDSPPGPGPSAADEKAAADQLKRAAIFANDPDSKDYYLARLRDVIKKYPGTAAAKDAQKKLNDLK